MTVVFRFAEPRDAAEMVAIYGPFCESSHVSFEARAPSVEEAAARIERVTVQYPWLACEIDGRMAGYAYACQHRERAAYAWSVEVTVYTSESCRRRGVGRGLYASLFSILRQQGYYKAYAGIALPNEPSVRLHEAVGFTPIGVYRGVGYKLGQWRDVGWWQLSLQPETVDPPPPRPIEEICRAPTVQTALAEGEKLVRPAAR